MVAIETLTRTNHKWMATELTSWLVGARSKPFSMDDVRLNLLSSYLQSMAMIDRHVQTGNLKKYREIISPRFKHGLQFWVCRVALTPFKKNGKFIFICLVFFHNTLDRKKNVYKKQLRQQYKRNCSANWMNLRQALNWMRLAKNKNKEGACKQTDGWFFGVTVISPSAFFLNQSFTLTINAFTCNNTNCFHSMPANYQQGGHCGGRWVKWEGKKKKKKNQTHPVLWGEIIKQAKWRDIKELGGGGELEQQVYTQGDKGKITLSMKEG